MHPLGVLGVDEEMFQKIMIASIILILIAMFFLFKMTQMTTIEVKNGMQCNEVIDKIYTQCREESGINISTIQGRNTRLTYENGVCIIK